LEYPFELTDRHTEAASYPNDWDFAATGGGVGGVLGEAEILSASCRDGERFWALVICASHQLSFEILELFDLPSFELACHALTLMIQSIGVKRCGDDPMFEIDLEWPVANQYVVRAATHPRGDRAIYVAKNTTYTLRKPLEENPKLYLEFANLDGSENACLKFAHQYGGMSDLRYQGRDPGAIDSLGQWRGLIRMIRDIIKVCELGRARPAEAFRQFGKRDRSLLGGLNAYLSIESPKSPPTLKIRCESLLAGIELQAVQSILGGRTTIQCIECSRWFEIGAGARRSQSKFCSTRCKDNYHNRLKAEAKRRGHA
jgi:hypothetical protein